MPFNEHLLSGNVADWMPKYQCWKVRGTLRRLFGKIALMRLYPFSAVVGFDLPISFQTRGCLCTPHPKGTVSDHMWKIVPTVELFNKFADAGAKMLGLKMVGDNEVISGNSVALTDLPANVVATDNPPRKILRAYRGVF